MGNLTKEEELLVRDFFEKIAMREDLFPDDNTKPRQLRGACLGLLGYIVAYGKIVRPEDLKGMTYGQKQELPDRWDEDTAALRSSLKSGSSNKTNRSKSS